MVFKLAQSAQRGWKRLRGYKLLGKVITGVQFVNGEELNKEVEAVPDKEAA